MVTALSTQKEKIADKIFTYRRDVLFKVMCNASVQVATSLAIGLFCQLVQLVCASNTWTIIEESYV